MVRVLRIKGRIPDSSYEEWDYPSVEILTFTRATTVPGITKSISRILRLIHPIYVDAAYIDGVPICDEIITDAEAINYYQSIQST